MGRHISKTPASARQSETSPPLCNHRQRRPIQQVLSSHVAEMGDRLATIDMGRKVGAVPLFRGGELGPHLTQCGLGRSLAPYQVAF